ncbi:MAG: hypothetical protein C4521_02505 [Actinobacteria bacterium]|nr:MAG: hypothetical protein C4521_02505 [Actinomycetota bacterium]
MKRAGHEFSRLLEKAAALGIQETRSLHRKDLIGLVCADCDFYKPGGEQLECAAFKILAALLEKEKLSVEDIVSAVR